MISGSDASLFFKVCGLILVHICLAGRLSGRRVQCAQTKTKAFPKQVQLWLPSVHHQITGVVWKSSDGGQQMRRKCFWSKKMARAKRDVGGEKREHCGVHVSLFQGACEETLNSEHWRSFFWPCTQVCDTSGCLGHMSSEVSLSRHGEMRRFFSE